ncbi:MAG: hypothetical protein P8L44_11270 [Opitutales bacterium]|nr:hypothetical protein [Opitutales bacterium]
MVYKITIRKGKPTASDIELIRRLTNRSIAEIRTVLAGEGFHLTKDYREDLMEKD